MKWQINSGIASIVVCGMMQAHAATLECSTAYASTSTSDVPTRTTTKTVNIPVMSGTYTQITMYQTGTVSYISVIGKETVTVPTGPSYTPLTDAPITLERSPSPVQKNAAKSLSTSSPIKTTTTSKKPLSSAKKSSSSSNKVSTSSQKISSSSRKASSSSLKTLTSSLKTLTSSKQSSASLKNTAAASSSTYPESVVCTSTNTKYHTTTTTATVYVTASTYTAVISTKQVATSTAYEACLDQDNVLEQFQGKDISADVYSWPINATCGGYSGEPVPEYASIACLNPRTCCEGAQQYNYQGWIWGDDVGEHSCSWMPPMWYFNTAYEPFYTEFFGNGPEGSGVYEDITFY